MRIPLVLILAGIAWVLELLDGATAILMMQHLGPDAELNPAVRSLFQATGPLGVVLLKICAATIVIPAFAYIGYRRHSVLAFVSLTLAIILASVGVASNVG
jgi:hypothetical protein